MPEERSMLAESLDELDSYISLRRLGPFAKPGWLRELFRWVHEQIAPLGLRVIGKFQQFNASPTFSLIRIETNGPAIWFKATGDPNRHELKISTTLDRLFSGYVPSVVGVHEAWNGWLSLEVFGTPLDVIDAGFEWERVASELATLQILSAQKRDELLGCQCKDLRTSHLKILVDPLFEQMTELMKSQELQVPAPLTSAQLACVRDRLNQALNTLTEIGLPDTIGHIDFNPGNILVSEKRCLFLDWAEGCVTNPLITFEYLREHFRREHPDDSGGAARIVASYLQAWDSLVSPSDMSRGMAATPLVAAFVYALTLSGSPAARTQAGFLRSLARRMYREAQNWCDLNMEA